MAFTARQSFRRQVLGFNAEVPLMRDENEPEDSTDESDEAAGVNFRDYPSSALVVIAALSSGLAWMLYKWLGRKEAAGQGVPDAPADMKNPAKNAPSPGDQDA